MSDYETIAATLRERVRELWGAERAELDATLIEAAAQSLARVERLVIDATERFDAAGNGAADA